MLAPSSALTVEVTCSSEVAIDLQWTTQHCMPENIISYNHCCENAKSCVVINMSRLYIRVHWAM
jgi:site-specific recombinase